jgi:hypothetical protein
MLTRVKTRPGRHNTKPKRVATVGVFPTVGSSLAYEKPTVRQALTVATRSLSFPGSVALGVENADQTST